MITFLLYLLAIIVGIWVGKQLEDDPVSPYISNYINAFDNGNKVEPIEFELGDE